MKSIARAFSVAACLLTLVITATTPPAAASTSHMQATVDSVIAKHGGEQTAWNEVSWDQGAVKLQIADPSVPLAAASCASGRYCVFSQASYLGSQLSYSTCPATHTSFAVLGGPVRSIANKLGQRTVRAYSSSTLKHTLPSGTSVASTSGITKITCA